MTDMERDQATLEALGYKVDVTSGNDLPGHWLRVWNRDRELIFHGRYGRDGRQYGGYRDPLNLLTQGRASGGEFVTGPAPGEEEAELAARAAAELWATAPEGTAVTWARGSTRRYGTLISWVPGTYGGTATIRPRKGGDPVHLAVELADVQLAEAAAECPECTTGECEYHRPEDTRVYGDDLPTPDDYAAEAPMPGDRW